MYSHGELQALENGGGASSELTKTKLAQPVFPSARRSAQLRPEEEAASRAEQYSRGVAGRAVRGWFEADDLRRVLPFFSLAFALVAAITQPSSPGDIALTAVPVAAWSLWAFVPNVPLAAVSVAIVVPVVVAQRSGELEPVMFNVVLLAFAAARWFPSLATAASLGVLAAATPVFVALVQDPMEVAVGLWVVGIAFIWVVGRAVARQERLVVELEGRDVSWPSRRFWQSAVRSLATSTTPSVTVSRP